MYNQFLDCFTTLYCFQVYTYTVDLSSTSIVHIHWKQVGNYKQALFNVNRGWITKNVGSKE